VLPPADAHDWLSLCDTDGTTWLFDLAFLLSGYNCIYGAGCPSIDPEPDPSGVIGCCSHGAHFVDDDDRRRVAERVGELGPGDWQHKRRAEARGGPFKQLRGGEWTTRTTDGACIFLNRDGFPGGAGCALHAAALRQGERPLDWKPSVCWQVPIRLDVHTDDYGHQTVLVRAWQRRDWGPGGEDFHWWCTEQAEAYTSPAPLYRTARDELIELVGRDLYSRLAGELDSRRADTPVTPVTMGPRRR
jgi:hypothetical protein